jgi:hypothetical protein
MNQEGGAVSQLVGGVLVIGLAVVGIAAIYQLNKANTPLVPDSTSVANNALSDIFK